ncbi:MAG: hypothetical protein Q9181_004422 [Wetmoreana brouardii]
MADYSSFQCDEAKPTCMRCIKSRRMCMPTGAAVKRPPFTIHVENQYVSGEIKRPRGPRSSLTMHRPRMDLQARALAYYMHEYLHGPMEASDTPEDLSKSILAWTASGRTCSMVDLALAAIALAVFSRLHHHQPAAVEASSAYFSLLQLTQDRIAQMEIPAIDEHEVDACLLAVSVMGRYESITLRPAGCKPKGAFGSLQNWSHSDGAMALLGLWNERLSHSSATTVMKQTRRGLIKSSLLRNKTLPEWILDGSRFGESGQELNYDHIAVQAVDIHGVLAGLQPNRISHARKAGKLYTKATRLDYMLQEWSSQFPAAWSYQQHAVGQCDSSASTYTYSPIVYSYNTSGQAAIWCQYFTTRMLVNSMRLRLLELSEPHLVAGIAQEPRWQECIANLEAMADSLASTIPYCLDRFKVSNDTNTKASQAPVSPNKSGEIKPYMVHRVIWPLTIASSIVQTNPRQQRWFKSQLARIGRITGIGVLECAETSHWAAL